MGNTVYYLTPLFARAAYEQIEAWHIEQTGREITEQILDTDSEGKNSARLNAALDSVGVSLISLVENGFAERETTPLYDCGSTGYESEHNRYLINMDKLRHKACDNKFAPRN